MTKAGSRLVTVGQFGHILLSDDRGQTWRQAQDVPTRVTLTDVYFPEDKIGYAVGYDAVILKTEDGGETWKRIHAASKNEMDNCSSPKDNPDDAVPCPQLFAVYFQTAQRGFAMGAFSLVLETQDGGVQWKKRKLFRRNKDDFHLNKIFAAADGAIYVAAEFGVVYESTNGGQTFRPLQTPYEGSFWGGIGFQDGSILLHGMRGNVWRASRGARNWRKVKTGTDKSFQSVLRLSNGDIVLAGLSGVVAYSRDGGRTFSSFSRPSRKGFAGIAEGVAPTDILLFGEPGIIHQQLPK